MVLNTSIDGLILKELGTDDFDEVHSLIQSNVSHLTRLGDYQDLVTKSVDDLRADWQNNAFETQFGCMLNGQLIGTVTLIQYNKTTMGLGYWIDQNHTAQGFTSAAVEAVIQYGKDALGVLEYWAGIQASNEPSIKLVKRLGFELARTQPTHLSYKLSFPEP